jgi:uncharacterized protein (TIGR02646 family)
VRHIDVTKLSIPEAWKQSAARALEEISALVEKMEAGDNSIKLSDEIERRANKTWRSLKPEFSKLSFSKCWYCESKYRLRLLEMDHFRPKNAIYENNRHRGYWWLAFDYTNFRLSCPSCNRLESCEDGITRGKGTHFPLMDENHRCFDRIGIALEQPVLLDPTNPADVCLLAFGADGNVVPKSNVRDSIDYRRAEESITIYHLRAHQDKRLARCREIELTILEANDNYWESENIENRAELRDKLKKRFERGVAKLLSFLDEEEEYTAASKDEMIRQAASFDWIEAILEAFGVFGEETISG